MRAALRKNVLPQDTLCRVLHSSPQNVDRVDPDGARPSNRTQRDHNVNQVQRPIVLAIVRIHRRASR